MQGALVSFRECGWPGWLCLFFGMAGLGLGSLGAVLALMKLRTAANVSGGIAMALGVLAVVTGIIGRIHGENVVNGVLDSVDPGQRDLILAQGMKEAAQCVRVGVGTSILPFVLGAVAVVIGMSVKRPAA